MKSPIRIAGSLLVCASLAACAPASRPDQSSAARQSSNFDPTVSFSDYRTYRLFHSPVLFSNEIEVPEEVMDVLAQSLRDTFSRKGYVEVETREEADFLVGYAVSVQRYLEGANLPEGFTGPTAGTWSGQHYDQELQDVQEGALAIHIFDADLKRPVYTTSGRERQALDSDRNDSSEIAAAVEALLADFPPDQ